LEEDGFPVIFHSFHLQSSVPRNRSLKSGLTNILSLHFHGMNDHFPYGIEARLWRLGLPEFQVE